MRLFDDQSAAIDHARQGEQGLFMFASQDILPAIRPEPRGKPRRCGNRFLKAVADLTPRQTAILYDLDWQRLLRTAIELKSYHSRIHRRGTRFQHIILTGWAVDRARRRCSAATGTLPKRQPGGCKISEQK